jgi:DUF4097 and DUF4098 domain-containing protein YvlB
VDARVPAGVRVRAETAFGDVAVRGPVGDVVLETGSGAVRAERIGGGRAVVSARSGDVVLRFSATPRDVEVEASSGDVTLRGVRHDGAAPRRIAVDTSAGDVLVAAN